VFEKFQTLFFPVVFLVDLIPSFNLQSEKCVKMRLKRMDLYTAIRKTLHDRERHLGFHLVKEEHSFVADHAHRL